MARLATANDIINRAAVECGLNKVTDPVASTDDKFIQFRELLDAVGQELVEMHPWQVLTQRHQITTMSTDTGTYDLPADFSYMIPQTGWEHSNTVPLGGPLSPQDWTYLDGRNLISQTIYASFRLVDNKFDLYPQPPPDGLDVRFEYIGRNWVRSQGLPALEYDTINTGSDLILYEPILAVKFLKAKYLEAKGFDASQAKMDFETIFLSRTGKDAGAAVLNAAKNQRNFPYLHPYYNVGDTGYGLP